MGKRTSLPSSSTPAVADDASASAAAQKKADKAARKAAKAASKDSASASTPAAAAAPATQSGDFDADLDAIFRSAGAPSSAATLATLAQPESTSVSAPQEKKETEKEKEKKKGSKRKVDADAEIDAAPAAADAEAVTAAQPQTQNGGASKRAKRSKAAVAERSAPAAEKAAAQEQAAPAADDEAPVFSDSDDDDTLPVHETVLAARAAAARHAPGPDGGASEADAARLERDGRSIFLGNVPLSVLSSRAQRRALVRHVLLHSPWPSLTKLSALRFRSVPFSVPTGDYAATSAAEAAASEKRRNRTRDWKAKQDGEAGKVWLTPAQKRKVAFINANINAQAHSLNAYLSVHPPSVAALQAYAAQHGASEQSVSLLQAPVLAAFIACNVDGTLFRGRHLRADVCASLPASLRSTAGLSAPLPSGQLLGAPRSDDVDAATSLFVGNLDFAADEEKLWAWCEATLERETGVQPPEWEELDFKKYAKLPAPEKREGSENLGASKEEMEELDRDEVDEESDEDDDDEEESDAEDTKDTPADADTSKPAVSRPTQLFPAPAPRAPSFLRAIRFVRDPATQMGKGFGYLRFASSSSVDELLALAAADDAVLSARKGASGAGKNAKASQAAATGEQWRRKMKFDGRPLRVARCKKQRPKPAGARAAGAGKSPKEKQQVETPKRSRSSGAPSPGGTSPSTRREARAAAGRNGAFARGGGGARTPTAPPVIKPSSSSAAAQTPNPGPSAPRDAEKEARLAAKRADPERAAKRAEKKQRKVVEARAVRKMGGKERLMGRVRLEQKKKSAGGKEGKKGGAVRGKGKTGGKRP